MRFLPHHNDSGGFFIAVMEKRADAAVALPRLPHRPLSKWREPPFRPLPADFACGLLADYGFPPEITPETLFVHDHSAVNNIYFARPGIASLIEATPWEELRAVSAGVRLFTWKLLTAERSVCAIPCIEGIAIVARFATKRVIGLTAAEIGRLMDAGNVGVAAGEFAEGGRLMGEPPGGWLVRVRGSEICYGAIRIGGVMKIYLKKEMVATERLRIEEETTGNIV
jgi:hypothetical protein